jgi:hypothetical protein
LKNADPEPVVRFETPPGQRVQADFTIVRRGRTPLLALVATLGYSRASFVKFTAGETRPRCADACARHSSTSVACPSMCCSILFPGTKCRESFDWRARRADVGQRDDADPRPVAKRSRCAKPPHRRWRAMGIECCRRRFEAREVARRRQADELPAVPLVSPEAVGVPWVGGGGLEIA